MMPLYITVVVISSLIGVPMVFSLAFGPFLDFFVHQDFVYIPTMVQRYFAGINKFELLAVPMFILAGDIMNRGGITRRLVDFSKVFVGHFRGGLAQVNIMASILFAGLSGSAVADTTALGAMLIPAMEKDGYTREYSAAVTAASSVIGPIIPPSIIMVVYSYIMEVSTGALFAAGVIPGLVLGIGLMIMTSILARKYDFPRQPKATGREVLKASKEGFLPMLTPLIILGGILFSIVSPTEAAILAVSYALFLSFVVFRNMNGKEFFEILKRSGSQSSTILLVVGSAAMFGWVLTITRVPQDLAQGILGFTDNPYVFLFMINIFLFIVGMFLDAGPAILILGPIFAPTLAQFGINPTHFAVVMCVNLTVGLATPPFGLVLFAASSLTGLSIGKISKAMLPYWVVHVIVIFILTFIPAISLTLPRLMGLPV